MMKTRYQSKLAAALERPLLSDEGAAGLVNCLIKEALVEEMAHGLGNLLLGGAKGLLSSAGENISDLAGKAVRGAASGGKHLAVEGLKGFANTMQHLNESARQALVEKGVHPLLAQVTGPLATGGPAAMFLRGVGHPASPLGRLSAHARALLHSGRRGLDWLVTGRGPRGQTPIGQAARWAGSGLAGMVGKKGLLTRGAQAAGRAGSSVVEGLSRAYQEHDPELGKRLLKMTKKRPLAAAALLGAKGVEKGMGSLADMARTFYDAHRKKSLGEKITPHIPAALAAVAGAAALKHLFKPKEKGMYEEPNF